MTNAEKLAKDTEALSDIINGISATCNCCIHKKDGRCEDGCLSGVKKWLESEAEDDKR